MRIFQLGDPNRLLLMYSRQPNLAEASAWTPSKEHKDLSVDGKKILAFGRIDS